MTQTTLSDAELNIFIQENKLEEFFKDNPWIFDEIREYERHTNNKVNIIRIILDNTTTINHS